MNELMIVEDHVTFTPTEEIVKFAIEEMQEYDKCALLAAYSRLKKYYYDHVMFDLVDYSLVFHCPYEENGIIQFPFTVTQTDYMLGDDHNWNKSYPVFLYHPQEEICYIVDERLMVEDNKPLEPHGYIEVEPNDIWSLV